MYKRTWKYFKHHPCREGSPLPSDSGIIRHWSCCRKYINNINVVYDGVTVDKYVIMPNHIHLIIIIDNYGRQRAAFPTLSDVVRSIKIMVRKETGKSFFQTSFYDHIIRNEQDYLKIWQYIDTNPAKWSEDRFYTE